LIKTFSSNDGGFAIYIIIEILGSSPPIEVGCLIQKTVIIEPTSRSPPGVGIGNILASFDTIGSINYDRFDRCGVLLFERFSSVLALIELDINDPSDG